MFYQRMLLLVLAGLAVCLGTGCPDKKAKYPACDGDKDCREGQFCVNKTCVACKEDAHCGAGEVCKMGACEPDENACTSDEECGAGQVCKDGACSACASNNECGPGGTCNAGVCDRPKACSTDEECEDDEDCTEGRCQREWSSDAPDELDCQLATVYFEFDQAAIPDSQRNTLQTNAECLLAAPTDRGITLYGHADESGTEEYNIALSEHRARTVANFLEALGIDRERMHIVPKGESEPSGESEEKDRRVEFQWR
jgi:peptidoglycan-associated lipoprotein